MLTAEFGSGHFVTDARNVRETLVFEGGAVTEGTREDRRGRWMSYRTATWLAWSVCARADAKLSPVPLLSPSSTGPM